MSSIEHSYVVLPWPILYETLRTEFVKQSFWIGDFKSRLSWMAVRRLDDSTYRDRALSETLVLAETAKRQLSLVDLVVRYMLEDAVNRIEYLATYNDKDFSDICAKRGIEIVH